MFTHLVMASLLRDVGDGDVIFLGQISVPSHHTTVPVLGARPVTLREEGMFSVINTNSMTTLWMILFIVRPRLAATGSAHSRTMSKAAYTRTQSFTLVIEGTFLQDNFL